MMSRVPRIWPSVIERDCDHFFDVVIEQSAKKDIAIFSSRRAVKSFTGRPTASIIFMAPRINFRVGSGFFVAILSIFGFIKMPIVYSARIRIPRCSGMTVFVLQDDMTLWGGRRSQFD